MNLVIVESPAKASTINKYLGSDYKVLASYGHVRDLPERSGSVEPDANFNMHWETQTRSNKAMAAILNSAKKADRVILATDPDREGEAISWHVLEILKQKSLLTDKEVSRVVFNAITRDAVLDAMAHPRELDMNLVEAYLARRALDYLVGFTLSPVLWRKLPGARSAGRVQSVSLRLICERELAIRAFCPQEYWSLEAMLAGPKGEALPTRLVRWEGNKLDRLDIPDAATAARARQDIENAKLHIDTITRKPASRSPAPPFTTSTLQQEASRKLGFSARQTMQIAQRLYEGLEMGGETQGLITYMRTDSQQLAPEAEAQIRAEIGKRLGKDYLPAAPRRYRAAAAGAQEAHEAVRPVRPDLAPEDLPAALNKDARALYGLIWKRALASQMENAKMERTAIDVTNEEKNLTLRANGTVVVFAGFLKLYEEGSDDAKHKDKDGPRLPSLDENASITLSQVDENQHFTEPPPRYNEASLVKKMEEIGIGRPSTYAGTLSVLRSRDYVYMEQKRLHPQDKGLLVVAFLENFFGRYVEYDFTADMETSLDKISQGEMAYREVLQKFWQEFSPAVEQTLELRNSVVLDRMNETLGEHIFKPPPVATDSKNTTDSNGTATAPPENAANKDGRTCPQCHKGQLSLKTGRFGAFIGCTDYPECRFTRAFALGKAGEEPIERRLGDSDEGQPIWLKSGRFGPYIQRDAASEDDKPKRVKLPDEMKPAEVTLADGKKLLSLPREVGKHPESKEPITADIGRYGPYLRHLKQSARLENIQAAFEIGVNHAVTLLNEPKKRATRGVTVLRTLGDHPEGGEIQILDGRFGPYVRHDGINASLSLDTDPEHLDITTAMELLAARAETLKNKKAKAKPKAKSKAKAKPKRAAKKRAPAKKKAKPKTASKAQDSASDA